jgi:hypothetical protein
MLKTTLLLLAFGMFVGTGKGTISGAGARIAPAQNACLIEGEVYSEPIRDCTETSLAVPPAEYASQCTSNASGPLRATVLKACPAKAQAMCVNAYGVPNKAYYYLRSPQSLADARKSCIAMKGKWVERPN